MSKLQIIIRRDELAELDIMVRDLDDKSIEYIVQQNIELLSNLSVKND